MYSYIDGLIVYPKDRPVDAKGRKVTTMLTIYGIPYWLPFVSPLHKFACPLLSG